MKKRLIFTVLCLCFALSVCALAACESQGGQGSSNTSPSEGLEFTLNADGESYSVSGIGTCTDTKIVIPETYNSKPITSIGDWAFRGCSELTSVTIPDSVTSIGYEAFEGCDNLKYNEYDNAIYLGNDTNPYVALIKAKNKDITSCIINDSTKVIADQAFKGCSSLTSVTIPDSVTSISYGAFASCSGLTRVTIPDSVISIGKSAFDGCSGLTSITIPANVTSIGWEAFDDCYKLVEVINKSSLNITKGSNDYGYVGLYALTIHNGESKIVNKDGYLFITDNGVNYLLDYVGNETSLVLLDNYNGENYQIYKYAFRGRMDITSVTIGNGVTSIGNYAFSFCSKLNEIKFNGTVAEWYAMTKGLWWNYNVPAEKVICSDGTVNI